MVGPEERERTLERIREICLGLPETSERLSHGAPTFFVREKKAFLMVLTDHHGDGRFAIWCAAPEGLQATLVEADPERFFVPPYVGHRGWLGVRLDRGLQWDELAGIAEDAYAEVAPRGLVEAARRERALMRPVVGITSYPPERVQWGVWEEPVIMIPASYVHAVERAGGRPLVLPPALDAVEETLDLLDGIVFSGGGDLDPAHYGAEPHPATDAPRVERDQAELALLTAALGRDLPVLAVCRGSQVLNVALGGDLVQHLPDRVGHDRHRHKPGEFADHEVTVAPDSRLGAILGDRAPVKSHHHQGYGRIGDGLVEVAWAEDGTVEGLEAPGRRFALGVLWHPEEGEDFALFQALVEQAGEYRRGRSG